MHQDAENLYNGGFNVYADFNCVAQTINVPSQVDKGATISGTGTFTSAEFEITYTISDGVVSNTCTARFKK